VKSLTEPNGNLTGVVALDGGIAALHELAPAAARIGVLINPASNGAASGWNQAPQVAPAAHAILLLDRAGWHGAKALKVPRNISLMPLPARAPELNPQENIWQFMRQNWLSNRVFASYDDVVDHCCYAWNTLLHQPWKIMSIARRDWANERQSS
jgi:DDE superfamily endonuclease